MIMVWSAVAPDVHTLILGLMPWLQSVPTTSHSVPPSRPVSPVLEEVSDSEPEIAAEPPVESADVVFARAHPVPRMFDVGPNFLVVPDVNRNSAIVRFQPDSDGDFTSWYYRVKFYDGSSWSPPIYLTFDDAFHDGAPSLLDTTPALGVHPHKYFAFHAGSATLLVPHHALWSVLPFPGTSFPPPDY